MKIRHPFYVIRDDVRTEQEGILGADVLKQQGAICDYKAKEMMVGKSVLKLFPQKRVVLKPRCEYTVIAATTNQNKSGIVERKKLLPGMYVRSCMVKSESFTCSFSIINTTEREIVVQMPHVKVENTVVMEIAEVSINNEIAMCGTGTDEKVPRLTRLKNAL